MEIPSGRCARRTCLGASTAAQRLPGSSTKRAADWYCLVVVGQCNSPTRRLADGSTDEVDHSDTWAFHLDESAAKWTMLDIAPPGPGRHHSRAVLDPATNHMWVYGGANYTGEHVGNQTLSLDLAPGAEEWTVVVTSSTPPGEQERVHFGLLFDTKRRRLVMLGGAQGFGGLQLFGGAWALPVDSPADGWIELAQTNPGPSPAFTESNAFYEPKADRYCVLPGTRWHSTAQFFEGGPSGYEREIWCLVPHDDDSVSWYELRTVLPGDLLAVPIHWIPERNYGISLHGMALEQFAGSYLFYSEEIRTYSILEAKAPWE